MNHVAYRLLPSATNMIRLDHTHVFSTFHQYKPDAPTRVKKGLVGTLCAALQVHAALEEEIFYPAMREVAEDDEIREMLAEHREMKRLVSLLERMEPEAIDYDETVMALMREVLHHVADEETVVLPQAERLLEDRLGELGARMTKRRLELVVPRSGEIALNMGRAVSGNSAALAATVLLALGMLWVGRSRRLRW